MKRTTNEPITVNEDVWFYDNPKSLEFVVWAGPEGKRQVRQFKILKSKLSKYLPKR